MKALRNASEVWKYINRRRRRKQKMENSIIKEGWRNHFMKILEEEEMDQESI